jgi:hypothetical protein
VPRWSLDGVVYPVAVGDLIVSVDIGELRAVDRPDFEGDEFHQRETPFTLVDGVAYVRNGASVSALAAP